MAGDDFLAQVLPAAQAYQGPPAGPGLVLPPGIGAPPPAPPAGPPPPDYTPSMGPIQSAAPPAGPVSSMGAPPPPPSAPPPPAPAAPAPAPATPVSTAPANAPMAGGVRVIPGHKVPAAELPQVGPSQEALWNKGQEKAEQAQKDLTEGRKTAAFHDAMQAQVDIDDARQREADALQRQRDQQAVLDQRRQTIDSATKELGSLKVDPNHFWASRSTAQNVAGLIGVALGGFAQGFSGGRVPNVAWEMIRSQMDDDLKAQVANIENKRAAVGEQQRQFQNLVQQYGMDSAKDMWAAAQRERVAAQARQAAASSAIPQIQAEGEAKAKEMQGEADKYRALAFKKYRPESATGAQVMVAGPTGEMIPIPVSPQKGFETIVQNQKGAVDLTGQVALKSMEQSGKTAKDQRDAMKTIVTLPDGRKVDAHEESAAKELRDQIQGSEEVRTIAERVLRTRQELGLNDTVSGNLNKLTSPFERRAKVAQLESDEAALAGAMHKAYGARFTPQEAELTKRISGKLTSAGPQADAAITLMAQRAQQSLGATLKTLPDYGTPNETVGAAQSAPIKEYK